MLAAAGSQAEQVRALVNAAVRREEDPEFAARLLVGLGEGLRRAGSSLEKTLDPETEKALASLFEQAAGMAEGDGDAASRVQAVKLVGLGPVDQALDGPPRTARRPATRDGPTGGVAGACGPGRPSGRPRDRVPMAGAESFGSQ